MSFVDSLKEQSKVLIEKTTERIRESAAYAQAQDRYENLSPFGQRMTRVFSVGLILILLLLYPMLKLQNSSSTLTTFEENRSLIRELFKTYRDSSSTQNVALPPSVESLKSIVDSALKSAELTQEQKLGVSEGSVDGKLIPTSLVSNVLVVSLAKLNLKQIVDIGASLVGISESVKLRDLSMSANAQDTRYYDVTYKLYTLKVPEPTPEPLPEVEKKSSGKINVKNKKDSQGADE